MRTFKEERIARLKYIINMYEHKLKSMTLECSTRTIVCHAERDFLTVGLDCKGAITTTSEMSPYDLSQKEAVKVLKKLNTGCVEFISMNIRDWYEKRLEMAKERLKELTK